MCSSTESGTGTSAPMDVPDTMENSNRATSPESEPQLSSRSERQVSKYYPRWRGKPLYDGNSEAIAWTMVSVSMAMQYIGSGAFFATALLRVAEKAYVCRLNMANETDADLVREQCGPGVGGLNATSLLTTYAGVVGLIAAIMLPFIGAVIDYTRHRLLIGRIMSILYTMFIFPLIFLNEENYVYMLFFHALSVFFGWFVTAIQYSYLPDLTKCELQLAYWIKCITIWTYAGMVVYLSAILGAFILLKIRSDLFLNRIGMATSFTINALCMSIAWWGLFQTREPLHEKPPDANLWTSGFTQLYQTSTHIARNYRGLKWFFIHLCFSDAGWQTFALCMLTYFTDFMKLNALQTSITIIITLAGSVPGAVVAKIFATRLDPIRSARINMVSMMLVIVLFVSVLSGVGQTKRAYAIVALIGFCGGWKYSMDKLLGAALIPEGQDTEMMGVFLFAGQCLSWLPLLVYTLLSEAGISPRINVAILIVYLVLSFAALCLVGSYTNARREVRRTSVYSKPDDGESGEGRIDSEKANADTDGSLAIEGNGTERKATATIKVSDDNSMELEA